MEDFGFRMIAGVMTTRIFRDTPIIRQVHPQSGKPPDALPGSSKQPP